MPRESAALYLWGAALLVSCSSTARGPRGDGVQASTDVPRPRPTGGGRSGAALDTSPVAREDDPEHRKRKKTYSFDLLEEYTRKTDGRRRPMPQQIWKGPEIKIHDAWETARPLRHD